ncbi:ligase-associated DNA damage response exonuclease [Lichenicola cladoniae]|uniref:Ligase-associated DNA damage response exonuclease n=1 Tax=Lichenicola cladoniae TaxID=1484109 RepID=A0A6M8HSU4_9PROT|nr:ligase-associated DNA damage response exonuclease [Lichenicola cladoniae]NPD65678.1 ligase-associated DNA damage response exonuclease [Acetobacteraceae bacterium]QKE91295.1 ligase-associated DNA damage response exonuclease [Lichenicola cladoniae]
MPHPETWLKVLPDGLYCEPGGFFIDPVNPVERALITHAHADHARPGHGAVLASPGTLAIMDVRMGEGRSGRVQQPLGYGEVITLDSVRVWMQPAGHVLGSAQIAMEWQGSRAVVSGDYKRVPDPTCLPFEPIACDVFVTEATFGLPVFRHPPPAGEVARLLDSVALFPGRTHVVGCYALGKCQRLIRLIREAGWDGPIYLHGALMPVCRAYEAMGVPLGDLRPATVAAKAELAGAIVLAPPSAIADRWARRLVDPVVCLASGWMRVRQRAKAKGIELPLVISDHADWDELLQTLTDVDAPEIWVTHGREEALIHAAEAQGRRGRALRLVGYGDEEEEGEALAADAASAPVPAA